MEAIHCDGCGEFSIGKMPHFWLIVGEAPDCKNQRWFCTIECLADWAKGHTVSDPRANFMHRAPIGRGDPAQAALVAVVRRVEG